MVVPNTPTSKALLLADQCSAIAMADSDAPPGFPQLPAGDGTAQGFALLLWQLWHLAQEIFHLLLGWHYQTAWQQAFASKYGVPWQLPGLPAFTCL